MNSDKHTIYIVGIGPGGGEGMTIEAHRVLSETDVIIGYETYIKLIKDRYPDKEYMSTPMKKERERCAMAFREAEKGRQAAIVCSGDAGIYGMASLMYEELGARDSDKFELVTVAGVTAAVSGAALLGAPIGHDFCVISLSDLLTPWELIERRLKAAADGDFVIVLYNPSSRKRADYLKKAADILMEYMEPERVCAVADQIGREGENYRLTALGELGNEEAGMSSTVFIGSSATRIIEGHMVTLRGYK